MNTDFSLRDGADADRLAAFGREFGENADLRRRFESDPRAVLEEQGIDVPTDVELRVSASTDDVYYLAMPPDPNAALEDENLASLAGGTRAGTASSVSSVGSFACSTGPSSIGSAGSIGSAAPGDPIPS